jgi:hypothetical protein
MDDELKQQLAAIVTLIENVKESLEHEIGTLRQSIERMDARLAKIGAGAHYVSRLVEWSEKQDQFQADTLRQIHELADRVKRLEEGRTA